MICAPARKRLVIPPARSPLWVPPRLMFPFPTTFMSTATPATVDPVLIQSVHNNATAGSLSLSWPGATTAGRLLVAIVSASRGNGSGAAPTITAPDGWTEAVTDVCNPTGPRIRTSIYYKANASSESGSQAWSSQTFMGTGLLGVIMAEYSGIATSSPLDRTASAADTNIGSTTCSSGTTSTTTQARELAIAGLCGGSTLGSASNSFTIQAQTSANRFVAMLDKLLTSTGTPSTSATYSTGLNNVGCIATFKVAN